MRDREWLGGGRNEVGGGDGGEGLGGGGSTVTTLWPCLHVTQAHAGQEPFPTPSRGTGGIGER